MIKINTSLGVLVFLVSLLLLPPTLLAQSHAAGEVKPGARKKWVRQLRKSYQEMNPDSMSEQVKIRTREVEGGIKQDYSIEGSGLIRFESGDWVYITLHSSHDNAKIGDVAIARDQDGNQYYHLGHVCGGAVDYEAVTERRCTTSEEFFQHFKDSTDDLSWHPLDSNHVPVPEPTKQFGRRALLWKGN